MVPVPSEPLVPVAPVVLDEPVMPSRRSRVWSRCELPVLLADELPLLWSFMLPVWLVLVPVRPLWPAVLLVCATAVALNMAAATEAPSIPLSRVFIFMMFSLDVSVQNFQPVD
jgi:hypothetical protein